MSDLSGMNHLYVHSFLLQKLQGYEVTDFNIACANMPTEEGEKRRDCGNIGFLAYLHHWQVI